MVEVDHRIGNSSVGVGVTTEKHHLQTQINSLPEHAPNRFKSRGIAVRKGVIKQQRKTAVMTIAQCLGDRQANSCVELFLESSAEL